MDTKPQRQAVEENGMVNGIKCSREIKEAKASHLLAASCVNNTEIGDWSVVGYVFLFLVLGMTSVQCYNVQHIVIVKTVNSVKQNSKFYYT